MPPSTTASSKLSIAIVSDLHCCAASKESPSKSNLIAGSKRTPPGQHPVQALLNLIKNQNLTADALVCPGDLAHQACPIGMIQAFDHLGEIQRKLRSPLLLPTVGNHDVNSRSVDSVDPFDLPKTIHPDFPCSDATAQDMFWNRGFYHQLIEGKAGFIVLNTVIKHTDARSAERGTFDDNCIDGMRQYLHSIYALNVGAPPIRVAVMHHHPIIHSTAHFGSSDTLEFGDQLLNVLAEFGFHFVIHGHRHEPRITRHMSAGIEQLIFAAGSFSAQLQNLSSITRNLFHHIELNRGAGTNGIVGVVRSWEFNFGMGWLEATMRSASIPHEAVLTSPQPDVELSGLMMQCNQAPGGVLRLDEIQKQCPQILRLLPCELTQRILALKTHGYKVAQDESGRIIEIGRTFIP